MNEFRAALMNGDLAKAMSPIAADKDRRRRVEKGLTGLLIPRAERRSTNQRREERYRGIVDRATLTFRGKTLLAKVVNISESGLMIETSIEPRIAEEIGIEFDGFEPLTGVIRWVRDGRIGLDLGEGAISLG